MKLPTEVCVPVVSTPPKFRLDDPVKKITWSAGKLALLENTASGFAALALIWSTVVVLGGYGTSIETPDFWFVTIISLIEGTRIIRRNQELESRSHATSTKMSLLILCMQLVSAVTCVVLCLYSLARQNYGVVDSSTKNRQSALNIFYGLSLADELLYLLELVWWKISIKYLIPAVNSGYLFQLDDSKKLNSFFCDMYSRCVNESVSEGSEMNFLSYSVELLLSSRDDKQLRGAELLSALARNDIFRVETVMAIGVMREVLKKLIDTMNWQHPNHKGIRQAAAEIISNISLITWDHIHMTSTTTAMCIESIKSLLYDTESIKKHSTLYGDSNDQHRDIYNFSHFSVLGLKILKGFLDHQPKIESNMTDLLPKIIRLTKLNPKVDGVQIQTVQLALELVKMFMQTHSSRILKDMNENALEIRNLVDVLQYREASTSGPQTLVDIDTSDQHGRAQDPMTISSLQILAINALKMFAEHHIRINEADKGALSHLFSVFLMGAINNELVNKAGETLHLLSLKNEKNCQLMMSVGKDYLKRLISLLDDPLREIVVAKILRNLFEYTEADCVELREISAVAAAKALEFLMEKQDDHQEAAIGLAAEIFKFKAKSNFVFGLEKPRGVTTLSLISKLLEVPLGRFSIDLPIAVINLDRSAILSSMSKEVIDELKRELRERNIQSDVFSFVAAADEHFHDD
jgi:hypothetical protein